MAIELKQELRLSQQLVMTPQLQQAIKLLQLSRLELVGLVQQELQENPVLEEVLDGEESEEAAGEEVGSSTFEAAAEPAPSVDRGASPGSSAAATTWWRAGPRR